MSLMFSTKMCPSNILSSTDLDNGSTGQHKEETIECNKWMWKELLDSIVESYSTWGCKNLA